MTFEQAHQEMVARAAATPGAVQAGKRAACESAAEAVRADWPVDSGDSAAAWLGDEDGVSNAVPYVPYVGDGLADRLVPDALLDAQPVFAEALVREIESAARGA